MADIKGKLDEPTLNAIEKAINIDPEFCASAAGAKTRFDIAWTDLDLGLLVDIDAGKVRVSLLPSNTRSGEFSLCARHEQWREFLAAVPRRPFQSYWGMLRTLGPGNGVQVDGDAASFTAHARLWRIVLDRVRDTVNSKAPPAASAEYTEDDERDDDSIVGHYTWLTIESLGKCKIFYETAGQGPQNVLFLHTAGADARQYHSLMLNRDLQRRCTMYAFDLPGHGRSFPAAAQHPHAYANSEQAYLSAIAGFLRKLALTQTVVSGASMGGQVCLAVALHAEALDVVGVVPCEACDYLPAQAAQTIYALRGDESVLNPERVCGMISPTSPPAYFRLNWWIYSAQAAGVFPGDLKFYFEGWDGRQRVRDIDTRRCPVYMLTGEYDYSCSPDASRATAAKIPGARFVEMQGLGHFPMSEDPARFIPYFVAALEHIWAARAGGKS